MGKWSLQPAGGRDTHMPGEQPIPGSLPSRDPWRLLLAPFSPCSHPGLQSETTALGNMKLTGPSQGPFCLPFTLYHLPHEDSFQTEQFRKSLCGQNCSPRHSRCWPVLDIILLVRGSAVTWDMILPLPSPSSSSPSPPRVSQHSHTHTPPSTSHEPYYFQGFLKMDLNFAFQGLKKRPLIFPTNSKIDSTFSSKESPAFLVRKGFRKATPALRPLPLEM